MRFATAVMLCFATLLTATVAQDTPQNAIQVELNPHKPLRLHVKLRSGAATAATIFRSQLPWGNRYSMVLTAVKSNGERIEFFYPEDEPGMEQVTIAPGASIEGDLDLSDVFADLSVTKKSDVHLFWAYKSPEALHISSLVWGLGSHSSATVTASDVSSLSEKSNYAPTSDPACTF
jgi:hypothetical protein